MNNLEPLSLQRTYLALGDSMSIDFYTGVEGGGAVQQFWKSLSPGWTLDDRTLDGCCMPDVPRDGRGEIVTLTIGGNDLLLNKELYVTRGLSSFADEHLRLLQAIRRENPNALFIVGDVYRPDARLTERELDALATANRMIHKNCIAVGARLVCIHDAFRGRESELLRLQIEPTLKGATTIAQLFQEAFEEQRRRESPEQRVGSDRLEELE